MLQISPQKPLPLIWNSADPNDTDTLYVQAVVQDASTGSTLDTINLVDKGSNLFMKDYTAPHDPSQTGTGRWISVVYTVYTDSGYTTKSQNYARISEKYLVKRLLDTEVMLGAGGGSIDYKELRRIIKEELDKQEPPEKLGAPAPVDLTPIITELKKEIQSVSSKVDSIKIPEFPNVEIPETDLSPVQSTFRSGFESLLKKIKLLPVGPNYTEAIQQLSNLSKIQNELKSNFQEEIDRGQTALEQYKIMLENLDTKTIALESVLEYLNKHAEANKEETNAISSALRSVNKIQRRPYKI